MAEFVRFTVGKELKDRQLEFLEKARKGGKIRIGINECTKAAEKGNAKLVLLAEDIEPKEIAMHLPILCEEKQVPYSYVSTKKELGKKTGIEVPTASVAVTDEGNAKKELAEIVKKVGALKK